jgi:hypothetical protein
VIFDRRDDSVARNAFYSFHYKPDNWRASTVRNIGVIEGNRTVSDNEWEEITSGGDPAIKKWITDQMRGKSCAIVLIGSATAGRKWINYEVIQAWNGGKGVVGIYVHNLLDVNGKQSTKGVNPFASLTVGERSMSSIVKAYDPPYTTSKNVYTHIADNMEKWVEEAIMIRNNS